MIEDARNKGRKVHFASLMDLCHLKNSEMEPQYQKYKGRVVLRGDIVKDDSGSYAVFTEQGSSASQMTAAKVRTSFQDYRDAQDKQQKQYPLIPRSKWKMHRRCSKFQSQNAHLLAGLSWERHHGWQKVPNRECLFVNREKGLFLSVYVDDIKLAGKKQNISPTWKILMKDVDLGEPTSFLDRVYLGCTQRECQISKDIVDSYRSMFESRISAWATEKNATNNRHGET